MCLPDHLLKGYRSFLESLYSKKKDQYQKLAEEGQSPSIMIIACCDSRVAPEIIFNASPGEMFVLRNVANLVPPYAPDDQYHGTSSALEYAVKNIQVQNIIVMGHAFCGGIDSVLRRETSLTASNDFIDKWMDLVTPAAKIITKTNFISQKEKQVALEQLSISHSLRNLRTFPFVESMEKKGQLKLHGLWFDILTGILWIVDPISNKFIPIDEKTKERKIINNFL